MEMRRASVLSKTVLKSCPLRRNALGHRKRHFRSSRKGQAKESFCCRRLRMSQGRMALDGTWGTRKYWSRQAGVAQLSHSRHLYTQDRPVHIHLLFCYLLSFMFLNKPQK